MKHKGKQNKPFKRKNYKKNQNRYIKVKQQIQKNKESEENLKKMQLGKKLYFYNNNVNNKFDNILAEVKYSKLNAIREREDSISSEEDPAHEDQNNFSSLLSKLPCNSIINTIDSDEEEEEEIEDEQEEVKSNSDESMEEEDEEIQSDKEDIEESDKSEISESSEEEEVTKSTNNKKKENNYIRNFQYTISYSLFEAISSSSPQLETTKDTWNGMGDVIIDSLKITNSEDEKENVIYKSDEIPKPSEMIGNDFTQLQKELLASMTSYKDLYYNQQTLDNDNDIKRVYCAHLVNHVLKAEKIVSSNNSKLKNSKSAEKLLNDDDSFRDQGFVRPKVLIIAPFRESANKIVKFISDIVVKGEKSKIRNYQRFLDEYTGETINFPKIKRKPEDYEKIFAGNTDDNFRVGILVKRNLIKLYTPFSASDIILASPLGLRMLIEAPNSTDTDFLSSLEILIIDQMDILFMQNWDHILNIFDHLHLQPQSRENIVDYSRIRMSFIDGWSKYYRQSLLFSSHDMPEFRSLLNNRCQNFRGKVRNEKKIIKGALHQVMFDVPQTFHRIDVRDRSQVFDSRFEYFVNSVLPKFKPATMAHCMIYVSSYFDFVRVRNYLKKESVNFTQISEYTKPDKVSRARTLFYHGSAHFLLYSERAHFYHRFTIKGVRHVIFYQPPIISNFYSEVINLMQDVNQNPNDDVMKNRSATIIYNKYDVLSLNGIVGYDHAVKLLTSKKTVHKFITNE